MDTSIKATVDAFSQLLGPQLEACYLYGSLSIGYHQPDESDINLLIVTKEATNLHRLREAFQPVWQTHQQTLGHTPVIGSHHNIERHLQLNPVWGNHLIKAGKSVLGQANFATPTISEHDFCAQQAYQLMLASAALAPNMLNESDTSDPSTRLRKFARRLFKKQIGADETAVSLFNHLHNHIDPQIGKLPTTQPWANTPPLEPSPLFPDLQAIYRHQTGYIVLVFTHLTPETILNTDWGTLGQELAAEYNGLYVVTAPQLRLILEYERPLDHRLRQYTHEWGSDPIASLEYEPWRILRQAARRPAAIQIEDMPHDYFTQGDDAIGTLIHDYQNHLLKVQLEHELLSRFGDVTRFTLPEPLPGREAPPQERLDAIHHHLNWWADTYTQAMQALR